MKNNKGKQFIELVIYLVLAGTITGVGSKSGIFEFSDGVFNNLKLSASIAAKLFMMLFFVLALEKARILSLSFFKTPNHRSATIAAIMQSIIRYTTAIIVICWGLGIVGVDVSTIVASVGILALIVGFGAESLIEDVITGLFMLFENQYNVGDIVEVGGFRGTVTDIGIRTTSITDAGGNVKIINNSNMKDILNRSDNASRAVSDIQVPYELDLEVFEEKLPQILDNIYNAHTDIMVSRPVYLGVAELADSGVTLRFVVEVSEKDIYRAQRILNRDLYVLFKKENVEVPYPQLDLHQK